MKTHKKQNLPSKRALFPHSTISVIKAFLTCLYIPHYFKRLETKINTGKRTYRKKNLLNYL